MQTDPLFRLPSKKSARVPLDSRFARLLKDEQFSSRAKVDRYGRRLRHEGTKGRNKELERLYRVADDERGPEAAEEESGEDDGVVQRELKRAERQYDPARDGGFSESSSSEGSTSDEGDSESQSDDEGGAAEGSFEFPDRQADDVPRGEVTSRLAVVNLDWDHIRAVDLMAVFTSFVPEGGRLLKVAVYPSEFGRERMDREAIEGPPKAIFPEKGAKERNKEEEEEEEERDEASEQDADLDDAADDDERIRKSIVQEDHGEEFNPTLLRRYQLERLRYYYAVLSCSSPACAEALYRAVDGLEYLATANVFDLRFVPDATDFAADRPRDACAAVPPRYRPSEFVTAALQHSRVALTWDADDGKRREVQKRAFGASRAEIDENDLKAYLGSDTSDDDQAPVDKTPEKEAGEVAAATGEAPSKKEQERQRMRALLGLGAERAPRKAKGETAPVGDMQITFTSGLSERKGDAAPTHGGEAEETTIEKYKRKEKERRMARKAASTAHDGPDAAGPDPDPGFDDPFFEAPEQASRAAKDAERQRQRAADAAAARQAEQQTAALAAHLGADAAAADDGRGGFDMRALERGEKALRRATGARGRARLRAKDRAALEAKRQDQFKVDARDPRFAAVYERSEFALDPGHPRFKRTEGMRTLLEEGRRKRGAEDGDGDGRARRRAV